ncbi:O-antigen ligase family protein [Providencia alcalifaciens]|uniref:O-antigen ligase family protein n=1 Tax=Providencia alcalifaciens TaxID=126385 RepID=UPI003D8129E0
MIILKNINPIHIAFSIPFILKTLETINIIPNIYIYYIPIMSFILSISFVKNLSKTTGLAPLLILFLSVFSYFIMIVNIVFSDTIDNNGISSLQFHTYLLFSIPFYFICGNLTAKSIQSKNSLNGFDLIIVPLILLLILLNTNWSYFRLDFESFKNSKAVYLFLGDTFAIISLYVIFSINNKKYRLISFFVLSFLLFLIFSRTSFYLFIFTCVLCLFIYSKLNKKIVYLILVVILSAIIFYFSYIFKTSDLPYSINRMLFMFTNSDDGSLNSRIEIFNLSFADLKNNFLLGNIGGQVSLFGYWNFYIHNILSYLHQFGIFFFLMLLIITLYPTGYFYILSKKTSNDFYKLCFSISIFVVLIYLLSRSYVYPYIFLLPALYIGLKKNETHNSTNW